VRAFPCIVPFFFFILCRERGGGQRGGRLMNSESCLLDGRTRHVMCLPADVEMPLRKARAEISKYPK
jgi:hypothetical protein